MEFSSVLHWDPKNIGLFPSINLWWTCKSGEIFPWICTTLFLVISKGKSASCCLECVPFLSGPRSPPRFPLPLGSSVFDSPLEGSFQDSGFLLSWKHHKGTEFSVPSHVILRHHFTKEQYFSMFLFVFACLGPMKCGIHLYLITVFLGPVNNILLAS